MKRTIIAIALILSIFTVLPVAAAGPASVFLLISGSLGDKGFNDSAKAGLDMIKAKYGAQVTTKYTELGADTAKYAPSLEDAGAEGYSVVLCSNNFNSAVSEIAARYPKTLYVMYDGWIAGDIKNVYSIQYKNSEAGYLAGALAGVMTKGKSDAKLNNANIIGFIGGRDITGINDFFVGYIAGAQKVNPDVKIVYNYVNSFTDTAKAKDQALIQFGTYKADVIYHAAGRAGLGLFDAAVETGKYAIGVDTDQASLFGSEPAKANLILSSTMKRVDLTLFNAFERFYAGEKLGGQKVYVGVAEGAVAFSPFNKAVPVSLQKELDKVIAEMKVGDLKIPSAFFLSAEEINKMRDSVNPNKK
ncbi:MAG: BMP family ABC transporter substrate-binding protein [Rectinemataceae bacterium]|nr:BMP family ABC transporter substrate-binding protein [Rectinemataceae bacterium]